MCTAGEGLVAVLASNYELSLWDLGRRTVVGRTVLYQPEDAVIERGRLVAGSVKVSGGGDLVVAAGYRTSKSGWVVSTSVVVLPRSAAVRVLCFCDN